MIATCFNRKEKTYGAIKKIIEQLESNHVNVHVNILDCGNDGTGELLNYHFSDYVSVFKGTEDIFWGHGMALLYDEVKDKKFDYLLAINDDINLFPDAIEKLPAGWTSEPVIIGCFCNENKIFTYGAQSRTSWTRPLKFQPVEPHSNLLVATGNMNFCLISKCTLLKYGFIDKSFSHRGGDYDLLLRYSHNGVKLKTTDQYLGICDRNPTKGTSRDRSLSTRRRLTALCSVKEGTIRERFLFARRYAGIFLIPEFLRPFIRCLN